MSVIRRHPLTWFVVLAYAITWAFQLVAIALAQGVAMTLSNEANYLSILDLLTGRLRGAGALALVLSMLGAGPLIASLLVTAALYGRAGLRDLSINIERGARVITRGVVRSRVGMKRA